MEISSKERKQPSFNSQSVIVIEDDDDNCLSAREHPNDPLVSRNKRARSPGTDHQSGEKSVHRRSKKSKKTKETKVKPKIVSESPTSLFVSGSSCSSMHTSPMVVTKDKKLHQSAYKHQSSKETPHSVKNASNIDEYSNFIKNKIAAVGKKVKTTKELLLDIQSRKLSFVNVEADTPDTNLKHESHSNEIILQPSTKDKKAEKCCEFESIELILSRLPPIDRSWMYAVDDSTPICTCSILYNSPNDVSEDTFHKSIFDIDYIETPKNIAINGTVGIPIFEEKVDPQCKAALHFKSKTQCLSELQIFALHNFFIPDVNGTLCDETLQFGSKRKPICRMDYWGSKPFYDCANRLFYNVVPKYKYLDYSLDRCVKNLSKVPFAKYKDSDAEVDTKEQLSENESNTSNNFTELRNKTETFGNQSDIPLHVDKGVRNESDLSLNNQNCDKVNTNITDFDIDSDLNKEKFVGSNDVDKKQRKKQLTYLDSVIMSLPLNLRALNAAVGYTSPNQSDDKMSDSFTSKHKKNVYSSFTYSFVDDPVILPLNYFKRDELINKFIQNNFNEETLSNQDGNVTEETLIKMELNCDDNPSNTVNRCAFNPELDKCVADGCPKWLDKLLRPKNFREWQEPVVKISYNNEPLTILPYVILD